MLLDETAGIAADAGGFVGVRLEVGDGGAHGGGVAGVARLEQMKFFQALKASKLYAVYEMFRP